MKKALLTLCMGLTLTGCASMFGDNNNDVTVNSKPAGATVYYNGQNVGSTPLTFQVASKWNSNSVRVEKEGYDPAVRQIPTKFQPVGAFNILFWPGFIIDAATGDMMKVATHKIDVPLSQTTTTQTTTS